MIQSVFVESASWLILEWARQCDCLQCCVYMYCWHAGQPQLAYSPC